MIDYDRLLEALRFSDLPDAAAPLCSASERQLREHPHGHMQEWRRLLGELPQAVPSALALDQDAPMIGAAPDLPSDGSASLHRLLQQLMPWRKGPFQLLGCYIDSEWRSDLKWRRLAPHIQPLAGRRVLDVGCGNGYHCWRMRGAGASLVLGIDPGQLNLAQFAAIKHYLPDEPVFLLPLADRDLTAECAGFDTIFSMGVLHHSRNPQAHLAQLARLLRPAGEVVVESLVIAGERPDALLPEGRYAKMRNVWSVPTPPQVALWLRGAGFRDVRLVNQSRTTSEEQRRTAWMEFESLSDFLDPRDPTLTVEGYPAPERALFLAEKAL